MQLRITPLPREGSFLAKLVEQLVGVLVPSPTSGASSPPRSTLIFTNTRSLAERLSWALRRALPAWDDRIAVHHSALAAHRRQEVEQRFKRGEMRVVVCSTSLELGIDIGTVDLVVLVHPPGDVVRLLQRIGRSGHGPEGIRAGLVFTDTPAELLEASVTSASGMAGQCEPICPPEHPLDVLCQQLVGMAMAGPWSADEAYTLVRQAMPYRNLSRGDLDDCLRYLLGGSDPSVCTEETEQTSWLPARLRRVRESHGGSPAPSCGRFTILDRRTARLMRQNLGTILDNETVSVHLCVTHTPEDSRGREDETSFTDGQLIGEVDQAFADRLDPGDRFLLDGRCLQFRRREQGVIVVDEVLGRPRPPRWAGEGWPLSAALAQRLYLLRVQASEALRESPATLDRLLQEDYGLEGPALAQLRTHFERQETVSEIPDPSCLLVELTRSPGHVDQTTLYIHTPLNRPGNDALARVAMLRLARDHGRSATSLVADLGLALEIRGEVADPPGYVRALLAPGQFAEDLDQALSESIALRERFGRVARTGLMLLRDPQGNGRRVGGRSWGERELFGRLRMRDPDFVLLRQSLREIRADLCDAQQAQAWLEVLVSLPIRCRWLAHVSPFAQAWTQLEAGPLAQATAHYEQDDAHIEALERLHALLTGGEHAGAE